MASLIQSAMTGFSLRATCRRCAAGIISQRTDVFFQFILWQVAMSKYQGAYLSSLIATAILAAESHTSAPLALEQSLTPNSIGAGELSALAASSLEIERP